MRYVAIVLAVGLVLTACESIEIQKAERTTVTLADTVTVVTDLPRSEGNVIPTTTPTPVSIPVPEVIPNLDSSSEWLDMFGRTVTIVEDIPWATCDISVFDQVGDASNSISYSNLIADAQAGFVGQAVPWTIYLITDPNAYFDSPLLEWILSSVEWTYAYDPEITRCTDHRII